MPSKAKIHDFLPGWNTYARRPRHEKEGLRIPSGPARAAWSSHSGGFKGNHGGNFAVYARMEVCSGIKNKGWPGKMVNYIENPDKCLASYGDPEAKKKFDEVENKLLSANPNRVTQMRLTIAVPREFLNNPDKNMSKLGEFLDNKYFSSCYTWTMSLHKGGADSKDFKNPHIHILFSSVDADLKNIRDFNRSNYKFIPTVKQDLADFYERELGIKAEVRNSKKMKAQGKAPIKHYPKWVSAAHKRALAAYKNGDNGALIKEYSKKYPIFAEYVLEKERKKNERLIERTITEMQEIDKNSNKLNKKILKDNYPYLEEEVAKIDKEYAEKVKAEARAKEEAEKKEKQEYAEKYQPRVQPQEFNEFVKKPENKKLKR